VRHLSIDEILALHALVVAQSGGSEALRSREALESCLAQPLQSFGGEDLYPSAIDKAAALAFFLVTNHPFLDGNKRVGHAALEVTLVLNGFELDASVGDQERRFLSLASGNSARLPFTQWVHSHTKRRAGEHGA
jgi:death-on-curing protein